MNDNYLMTVGLEVHVELATATKMFCRCPTEFGAPPNTNVCPVCLGLPGGLPVPNAEAIRLGVRAALALGAKVNTISSFDRKCYFYPDLVKGYQITQAEIPLGEDGVLRVGPENKPIRIQRIHLEEDTGKSIHAGDDITTAEYSYLDFNRSGAPLVEIVSEPDISSPLEARLYLEKLQRILRFARVSDVKMEEGSMRVDCNISVRPSEEAELGVPVELKNLSSFRAVVRSLEYEYSRQCEMLASGQRIERETRHWDEARDRTYPMRTKGETPDYMSIPEPDLPQLELEPSFIQEVRDSMPPLPEDIIEGYVTRLGLPVYDAEVLTQDPMLAAFFDQCVGLGADPKTASNWIMGELLGYMNRAGLTYTEIPIRATRLVALLQLIASGTISAKVAKDVLVKAIDEDREPRDIVSEDGLSQMSDEGELGTVVDDVIARNPGPVEDVKSGKEKAIGFLVGQVMKATKGRANPGKVNIMLKQKILR